MPSIKIFKSIAHNVAHNFASTLNYWKDDYAIHHLWNAAKKHDVRIVKIDILNTNIEPKCLNEGRVKKLLPSVLSFLMHLIESENMKEFEIEEAILEYNFGVNRISLYDLPTYDCKSSIKVSPGKVFQVHLTEKNN